MQILKRAAAAIAISGGLFVAAPASAQTNTVVIDVTGAQAWGEYLDPRNTLFTRQLGNNARITHFSYNFILTANAPSSLSDAAIYLDNYDDYVFAYFTTEARSGTGRYSDSFNLIDLGLDFVLDQNGRLFIEFADFAPAEAGYADAIWNSGTITIGYDLPAATAVPEPATWSMMIAGFGAIGGVMRRRQKASVRFAA